GAQRIETETVHLSATAGLVPERVSREPIRAQRRIHHWLVPPLEPTEPASRRREGQDMPLSGTTPSSQRTASADERILLSTPDVGPVEEEFLLRAFRGGWIAPTGPDLRAFEDELAAEVGVRHAVGLSSGTAALHMGLLGLGVRPGDAVVTSTMTFAATANAITYCGARPHFVDCASDGNMDPALLHRVLKELAAEGRAPAAIVP